MRKGFGVCVFFAMALAALGGAALSVMAVSCVSMPTKAANISRKMEVPSPVAEKPVDLPGLRNVVAYHEGYLSGGVPEGEAGFLTLAGMGVRTIISVDGAEPEVARAALLGMRYIHLPIGYNGFDERRKLELVRASRDALAQGLVYVHCHHGKHRSAGAAGTVVASLGWAAPEEMVERMRVSGTSPSYFGLYACTSSAGVLRPEVIDAVDAEFPSVAKPSGYVKGMIEIDAAYENLKAIEKAGWSVPPDHPDLVPAAEAGRLADLHRVLTELDQTRARPEAFSRRMREGQNLASELEEMLGAGRADPGRLSDQFKLIGASCRDCHVRFRDAP